MESEVSQLGNKAIVRRFVEEFQAGGLVETATELLAEDFRNRTPRPGERDDRDGVLQTFRMLHTLLPDLRIEIHDMLADGDRVATRKTFRARHPSASTRRGARRTIDIAVMDIVRLREGRIVEHWNSLDLLSVLRQLGLSGMLRLGADRLLNRRHRRNP